MVNRFINRQNGFFIDSAEKIKGAVFVSEHRGFDRNVAVISPKGDVLAKFSVPSNGALSNIQWSEDGKHLSLKFSSQVNPGVSVAYDLASKRFNPPDFESQLMVADGKHYVSKIINIASNDGTKIPIRVTHLEGLALDGSNPGYMSVYGGFNSMNAGVEPRYGFMEHDFLQRGGVIAAPALRGGNEFGNKWHEAGQYLNKHKTLEDINSTTDFLVQNGFVSGKKMIITGASNGGFTSAAAALEKPDLYGLVIPVNGVTDFARAEALDPDAGGFAHEYGLDISPGIAELKKKLSPVENAQHVDANKYFPEYLIVTGQKDSRVNSKHSYHLYEALKAVPDLKTQVNMILTPNAGHFSYAPTVQKTVGVATRAMIWTRIYDFLGYQFH